MINSWENRKYKFLLAIYFYLFAVLVFEFCCIKQSKINFFVFIKKHPNNT